MDYTSFPQTRDEKHNTIIKTRSENAVHVAEKTKKKNKNDKIVQMKVGGNLMRNDRDEISDLHSVVTEPLNYIVMAYID